MDLAHVFLSPKNCTHRQYGALRAYFVERLSGPEVAQRFDYTHGSFHQLAHTSRQQPSRQFFVEPTPPGAKLVDTVRQRILQLRKQNQSVYDISEALKKDGHSRTPAAVAQILRNEGFARLPRRADDERPQRTKPTAADRADARTLSLEPRTLRTKFGGLFLFLPALDFPPIRFDGKDALVEKHYVSKRSRSQRGILAFLAQDGEKRFFCYANSDLRKDQRDDEILKFVQFWKERTGRLPEELIFDSKLTTYANLNRLNQQEVHFITLRRRSPQLLNGLLARPRSAWRRIDVAGVSRQYKTPRILDEAVTLADYSGPIRP